MQFDAMLDALEGLELEQIQTLRGALDKAEKGIKKRRVAAVKAEIGAKLAAEGLSIADLAGSAAKKAPKAKLPPKYRDPANAANEWSGRGRVPVWMQGYLETGRDKSEFLIDA